MARDIRAARIKAVGIAVAASILLAPAAASAAPQTDPSDNLSASIQAEYIAVFEDHGIEEKHWDSLLDKLGSGQLLDADRSDSEPTSTEEASVNGELVTRMVFEDGSVAITTTPDPIAPATTGSGEIQPLGTAVQNCSKAMGPSGTTGVFSGCRTVYDGISFSYSFYADGTYGSAGAGVSKAYNSVVHRAIGHSVSDKSAYIVRAKQSGSTPAQARMEFQITTLEVLWSRTITLDLFVQYSSFSSATNL